MNTKVDEGKLISGEEALTRVTEGIVQCKCDEDSVADRWTTITDHFWDQYNLGVFLNENTTWKFRFKPRTITINGIEMPAPAEDEDYHHQGIWILNSLEPKEYGYVVLDITDELPRYWWRTEEEIKQVVSGLRQVFGGSHDN